MLHIFSILRENDKFTSAVMRDALKNNNVRKDTEILNLFLGILFKIDSMQKFLVYKAWKKNQNINCY